MEDDRVVFISYVREDLEAVDALATALAAAGVTVWRDTAELWPGDDWRAKIKDAITRRALVMIACFSTNASTREKSYMNEELALAAAEIRMRRPDRPWLFPVRLDNCDVPPMDLGGGRELSSLHWVDLFGDEYNSSMLKLVYRISQMFPDAAAIQDAAIHSTPPTTVDRDWRQLLRAPGADIEFYERLTTLAAETARAVLDPVRFPVQGISSASRYELVRSIALRSQAFLEICIDVSSALAITCQWGKVEHELGVARAMERLASVATPAAGLSAFLNLRKLAVLVAGYCATMGAIDQRNWPMLRAALLDPTVQVQGGPVPVAALMNTWLPFEGNELGAQVVILAADGVDLPDDLLADLETGRKGKRHTPGSDWLHQSLRPWFSEIAPDDAEYTSLFDSAEVILGAVLTDLNVTSSAGGPWIPPASFGSFTWRYRHDPQPIETKIRADILGGGPTSGMISAGFFGGDRARAETALDAFGVEAGQVRQRRF